MKIKIVLDIDIDAKEYYEHYRDYYDPDENKKIKDYHRLMKNDMTMIAQHQIQEWAKKHQFKSFKMKNKLVG